MEIKDILEMILSDQVVEGLGFVFCVALLWTLFFGGGINQLIELFGIALYG